MYQTENDSAKERYSRYLRTREWYIDRQQNQWEQFDKHLLYLAAGSFGISFSFISNIVKKPLPEYAWLLVLSWFLMALSIFSTLFSFISSHHAFSKTIDILDTEEINGRKDGKEIKHILKIPYANLTLNLNRCSLLFFILGILIMLIYIMINFGGNK